MAGRGKGSMCQVCHQVIYIPSWMCVLSDVCKRHRGEPSTAKPLNVTELDWLQSKSRASLLTDVPKDPDDLWPGAPRITSSVCLSSLWEIWDVNMDPKVASGNFKRSSLKRSTSGSQKVRAAAVRAEHSTRASSTPTDWRNDKWWTFRLIHKSCHRDGE